MTGRSRSSGSPRSSRSSSKPSSLRHHDIGEQQDRACGRGWLRARCVPSGDRLDLPARLRAAGAGSCACRRCRRRRAPATPSCGCAEGQVRRHLPPDPRGLVRRGRCRFRQPAQRLLDVGFRAHRRRGCAAARRRCGSAGRCAVPNGIETMKVVPRPTALSTRMVPPWSLTSSCTSARPIPEPSNERLLWPSTRWNRSNKRGSSCSGMPTPVSRTINSAARPSADGARLTAISPSNVNLKALESRLSTIFSHMSRST